MRKAQAAMEFLMTYGWAILVVLAAIGALAFFGVFDLASARPEICQLGNAGLGCDNNVVRDIAGTSDEITFRMRNGLGFDIADMNVTISTSDCSPGTNVSAVGALDQGATTQVTFTCDLAGVSAVSGDLDIDYRRSGETVTRQLSGSISGPVQN